MSRGWGLSPGSPEVPKKRSAFMLTSFIVGVITTMKIFHLIILIFPIIFINLSQTTQAQKDVPRQPVKPAVAASEPTQKQQSLKTLLYLVRPYKVNNGMIYAEIAPTDLAAIQDSPFDSFGMSTGFPYHQSPPRSTVALVKEKTKKKIWPRLLIPQSLYDPDKKVFGLWDEDRQAHLLSHLKEALTIAQETKVPGIIIDPEIYLPRSHNDYSIPSLAARFNKTPEETIQRLQRFGHNLAECVHTVFGEKPAVLWFLFTNLASPLKDGYRYSIAYFIEGILKTAKAKNYPITVVDGGETGLGYVNVSVPILKAKIARHYHTMAPFLTEYHPHLKLGATTVLINDITKATGVWAKLVQATPAASRTVEGINDYLPILKELFQTYEYVWIYWDGGNPWYNDFEPKISKIYRPVIEAALPEAYKKAQARQ